MADETQVSAASRSHEYSECFDVDDNEGINEAIVALTKNCDGLPEIDLRETIMKEINTLKIALIVVDFQNDFISGSLCVKNGNAGEDPLDAIPLINSLAMETKLECVIYTQDWHPQNHISFVECARDNDRKICSNDQRAEFKVFDAVLFDDPPLMQVLYPSHCVQYTWGAELHSDLILPKNGVFFIKKGQQTYIDSYSAFAENGHEQDNLENLLRSKGITAVFGCGLTYDICVRQTLHDASKRGFLTAVVRDCSKGFSQESVEDTNRFFACENIAILNTLETSKVINGKALPIEWLHTIIKKVVHECPAA